MKENKQVNTPKEIIKKFLSDIAKEGHKKNPRSKEFYKKMQKKAVKKRLQNKEKKDFSTVR